MCLSVLALLSGCGGAGSSADAEGVAEVRSHELRSIAGESPPRLFRLDGRGSLAGLAARLELMGELPIGIAVDIPVATAVKALSMATWREMRGAPSQLMKPTSRPAASDTAT